MLHYVEIDPKTKSVSHWRELADLSLGWANTYCDQANRAKGPMMYRYERMMYQSLFDAAIATDNANERTMIHILETAA